MEIARRAWLHRVLPGLRLGLGLGFCSGHEGLTLGRTLGRRIVPGDCCCVLSPGMLTDELVLSAALASTVPVLTFERGNWRRVCQRWKSEIPAIGPILSPLASGAVYLGGVPLNTVRTRGHIGPLRKFQYQGRNAVEWYLILPRQMWFLTHAAFYIPTYLVLLPT
jgi:hypothetical protein